MNKKIRNSSTDIEIDLDRTVLFSTLQPIRALSGQMCVPNTDVHITDKSIQGT